jgi:hypothetical protein
MPLRVKLYDEDVQPAHMFKTDNIACRYAAYRIQKQM